MPFLPSSAERRAPVPVARWSLRVYLIAVILIATVPMAVLSFFLLSRARDSGQALLEESLRGAARSDTLLVANEIGATVDALGLLARSPELTDARLEELHARLQQLPLLMPSWHSLYVASPGGEMLLSTLVPYGTPLAGMGNTADHARALRTQGPVVRNLQKEPVMGELLTGVQIPVRVDGRIRYFLGVWLTPARWQRVLQTAGVPHEGVVSLFDGQHHIVARSRNPGQYFGQPLPEGTVQRINEAPSGIQRISLPDRDATYVAWQRMTPHDWGVSVEIPAAPVESARIQGLIAASAGALLSLATGIFLAWLVGRHVTVPLRQLARAGASGITGSVPITEIAHLRDALKSLEGERQLAVDRLRATADELQVVFSTTPVGLAIAQDRHSSSVLRNPALLSMFGATPQAPQGTATVLCDGRTLSLDEQPLQRCARLGIPIDNLELTVVHPDGQTLKVLAHALPLTHAGGQLRGAVAGFVDVTQRVEAQNRIIQAEQRLRESRQMVELAQQAGKVGFFDYHFEERMVRGTAGLAQLLGMPAQAFELPWGQWMMCLDPRDTEAVQAAIDAGGREGTSEIRFEFRSRERGEDVPRWFASRCTLMLGANNEPVHLIGVVLDITEQKFAERDRAEFLAEQQKARRAAEDANRAKDEFLAMLGHELRNPLGAISAAAEVMSRAPAPELADRARTIIQHQTRHLAHLMEDLLDVTRVISGKITLARQPYDLQRCVDSVVNTMQLANQLHQHTLELDLQPAWVQVDVTRAEQIINNLLTNALKYTPQGGTIKLSTWRDGPMGVLRVQDDGMGMSPALVSTVFDLFVQGERSLDRRQGGLGVGLTLVRRLAELHGGFASAESPGPGQGSCFTVYLPGAVPPTESLPAPAPPVYPARTHRHIVIVEDNADARDALRVVLQMDGYEVETAEEGVAGLALILRTRPDAALIDIGLPGLNGLEIATRLRQAGLTLRLVAVSGYGQAADVAQALAAGFDSHVIKPIDPLILAQRLGSVSSQEVAVM